MNRFRQLLLLLLSLCLITGCNRLSHTDTPPVVTGFTCAFSGSCRGQEVAGTLTRTGAGLLTVALTRPEELNGLLMEWDGEQMSLKMLGLTFAIPPESVPQAALGRQILTALDTAVAGGNGTIGEDGCMLTAGGSGDDAFTLHSDPATGTLLALEVPGQELSVTFSEFEATA